MIELTDQNFEKEILNSSKLILVDFYTSWCPPCKILGPILEKISQEFKDEIIFTKINIDSNPVVSQKFKIESIPTVALFKNGEPLDGFVGAIPEPTIREWLDKNLNLLKSNNGKSDAETCEASAASDNQIIDVSTESTSTPSDSQGAEDLVKKYQAMAEEKGIKINTNKEIVKNLINSLLENEKKYGARYCPCRRVTGKKEEDYSKICPCDFLEKEIQEKGQCLCGLFVK